MDKEDKADKDPVAFVEYWTGKSCSCSSDADKYQWIFENFEEALRHCIIDSGLAISETAINMYKVLHSPYSPK